MTHFSNSTDAEIYEANYCCRCEHFKPDEGSLGCPILNMHFDHAGDEAWQIHLDEMIPPAPGPAWHGECAFFSEVEMKPDRLYTPPPPTWTTLLRKAAYELKELAALAETAAEYSLSVDQHEYMNDSEMPDGTIHHCDDNCPGDLPHDTGLWLHKGWAQDCADEIEGFLARYALALDPEAEAMRPSR